MHYTRSALGLLSAQYRSVLKKCFLINMGLLIGGGGIATPASALDCPDGYKCYGENFGDKAELNKSLPDAVKQFSGERIFSGDWKATGSRQLKIDMGQSGTLKVVDSTIDLDGHEGFIIEDVGTGNDSENGALNLQIKNTTIKNALTSFIGNNQGITGGGLYAGQGNNYNYLGENKDYIYATYSLENVNFENNGAKGYNYDVHGGAIAFAGTKIDKSQYLEWIVPATVDGGKYTGNYAEGMGPYAYAYGGAIYAQYAKIDKLVADFYDNYAKGMYQDSTYNNIPGSLGGAIANYEKSTIGYLNGTFDGNYATYGSNGSYSGAHAGGGAIFSYGSIGQIGEENKHATFNGNYALGGGFTNAAYASNKTTSVLTAFGGAIALEGNRASNDWAGRIGSIYADFTDNYAKVEGQYGAGAAGGAIAVVSSGSEIKEIYGSFTNNKSLAETGSQTIVGEPYGATGGAIYNIGSIGKITADFTGNKAYNDGDMDVAGGAIFNWNRNNNVGIQSILNSNFYNNVAENTKGNAYGGAIFTQTDLTIKADNATSEFKGNKVIDKSGERNEAIYVYSPSSSAQVVLTLTAVNGGTISLYDAINGADPETDKNTKYYMAKLYGDMKSTINLYDDILNANVEIGSVNINTANNDTKTYDFYNLRTNFVESWRSETPLWTIDFDVKEKSADVFATKTPTYKLPKYPGADAPKDGGYSYIYIDHFNLFNGEFSEVKDKDFIVQIIKTQGTKNDANLQLKLSDKAQKQLGDEILIGKGDKESTGKDMVQTDTNWSDLLYEHFTHDEEWAKLGVTTKETKNDSIGVVSTEIRPGTDPDEWLGDTLWLVNTAENVNDGNIRNFIADADTYTVHASRKDFGHIGTTASGELNINGVDKEKSVLDGNGMMLFDLSEAGTIVSLNDVKVTNSVAAAKLSAKDAVLNLNNVELSGNQNGIENEGTINISGVNKILEDISGSGTTNVNSDWVMESKISGNTVTVNNAKLTIGKDNLAKDVDLHATKGGEVIIANNLISLHDAAFDANSQLSLKIDNLEVFGGIRADSYNIKNGSTLQMVFGQNVLNGETEAEIPVLAYTDGSDINVNFFTDDMHNNMYGFHRKSDNSGIYMINQKKTAEEVSKEHGGTPENQEEAKAWVDGPSHKPGAKDIADDLAGLAQTDGNAFNDELTALAPSTSPIMSFLGEINNRLFYAVDNYLRNDKDMERHRILKIDEKTGKPVKDIYGINIWAMPYYGESKHDRTGRVYGFNTDSRGIIAAIDKQVNKNWKLGFGGRYEDSVMETYRKDYDINTFTAFAYGEYKPSEWFANGIVKWDDSDWDERRYAVGRTIRSHFSVDTLSTQLLGGYEYEKNDWFITPQAGVRWHHIHRYSYNDTAWQSYTGKTMDVLSTVAGVHIQKDAEYNGKQFRPDLYIGVSYDFIADRDRAVVGLSNGTKYTVVSERLKRLAVEVSPSITYNIYNKWSANIQYTGAFRDHYQNHTAYAGLKYEF